MSKLLRVVGVLCILYAILHFVFVARLIIGAPIDDPMTMLSWGLNNLVAEFFGVAVAVICFAVAGYMDRQKRIEEYLSAQQKRVAARRSQSQDYLPIEPERAMATPNSDRRMSWQVQENHVPTPAEIRPEPPKVERGGG